MVGEIRDPETARMAIQASLTGHLVLSTVHTNSAAASIARLLDMGVEDYLLATSIAAVTAQRLVRRLCGACAAPAEAPATLEDRLKRDIGEDLMAREVGEARLKRAVGCQACRGTGYQGRTVVAELLDVVPAVRHAILTSRSEHAIAEAARASGMRSMYEDGVVKALCGETTLEEVLRVTRIE
jgi:general secretion pathway protein E